MNPAIFELVREPLPSSGPLAQSGTSAPDSDGATAETPFADSLDSELAAENAPVESPAEPVEAQEAIPALEAAPLPDLAPTAELLAEIARELEQAEVGGPPQEIRAPLQELREARADVRAAVPVGADEAAPRADRLPNPAVEARAVPQAGPAAPESPTAEAVARDAAAVPTSPRPPTTPASAIPIEDEPPVPADASALRAAPAPAGPDVRTPRPTLVEAREAREARSESSAPASSATSELGSDATLRALRGASAAPDARTGATPLAEPAAETAPVTPATPPPPAPPAAQPLTGLVRPDAPTPADSVPLHVEWLAERGGGRARLELHPPHLGRVELAVRLVGSEVHVTVVAHESAAQTLLQSQRDQLAETLSLRELELTQFEVGDRDGSGPRDGARHDDLDLGWEGPGPASTPGGDASLREAELPTHTPHPRSGVDLRV